MKARLILLMLSAMMATAVFVACGNNESGTDVGSEEVDKEELKVMSMEEVRENDGKDGRNAYIVVDGIVYDVTGVEEWAGGEHNGNQAGQDLTDELENDAPHGAEKLENAEAVGRIED